MNVILAFSLFSLIILIYWVIAEFFTFLFRFRGVPEEKARFQVVSLLTCAGYTTRESELFVSTRSRRRLTRIIMMFGYVFNVTFISALINVFISLKNASIAFHHLIAIIFPVTALGIIFMFMKIPKIHAWGERHMQSFVGRMMKTGNGNIAFLLDYIGDDSIVQIILKHIPEKYVDKPLSDTDIRSEHKILIMLVEHEKANPPTAETVFQVGDKLTVFGNFRSICEVFEAQEYLD